MNDDNPQEDQGTSRIDDPDGLVKDILTYESGRIRVNARKNTGVLRVRPGGPAHIGTHGDNLVIALNKDRVDDHYATLTNNGYQTVITAGPQGPITIDYNTADTPKRIQPRTSKQLYTEQQLIDTTKNKAVHDVDNGVTHVQLYNVTDEQATGSLRHGRIGFSNQSLYKALRITELGLDADRVLPRHVTDDTNIRLYDAQAKDPWLAIETTYKPQPTQ